MSPSPCVSVLAGEGLKGPTGCLGEHITGRGWKMEMDEMRRRGGHRSLAFDCRGSAHAQAEDAVRTPMPDSSLPPSRTSLDPMSENL